MIDKTKKLSRNALMPLIRHAQKHRGTVTQVANRLTKLTGKQCYRQHVERLLAPDEDKRTEPLLGMGLMLMRVQDEICGPELPPRQARDLTAKLKAHNAAMIKWLRKKRQQKRVNRAPIEDDEQPTFDE